MSFSSLLCPSVLRRWCEGMSLWLAVLLMLSVHPLFTEAGSLQPEQTLVSHICPPAASADGGGCVSAKGVTRWSRRYRQ